MGGTETMWEQEPTTGKCVACLNKEIEAMLCELCVYHEIDDEKFPIANLILDFFAHHGDTGLERYLVLRRRAEKEKAEAKHVLQALGGGRI
jgi:hypothetical protein